MMNFKTIITDFDRATVRLAEFAPEAGAKEYNLVISTRLRGAFAEQVDSDGYTKKRSTYLTASTSFLGTRNRNRTCN